MKILITGGGGFIGSHLVEHYQNRAEIIVLDNLRTGHRRNLDGLQCRFVEGSILDQKLLGQLLEGVDYVFHLAALVSVPESMERLNETIEINVRGFLNVLEVARKAKVKKLVFASSAAVYGEDPAPFKLESQTPDPQSPYAITKLDGEYYCKLFTRENGLSTASLRFFNVFGSRQDPNGAYAAAVPIFLKQAREGKPIAIYGDGKQTRDFIYVKDIVGALAFAAERIGVEGVFNAGYGTSLSILELAEMIKRATNSSSGVEFLAERPGDLRHSTAGVTRLLDAGWKPIYSVEQGLQCLSSDIC